MTYLNNQTSVLNQVGNQYIYGDAHLYVEVPCTSIIRDNAEAIMKVLPLS